MSLLSRDLSYKSRVQFVLPLIYHTSHVVLKLVPNSVSPAEG